MVARSSSPLLVFPLLCETALHDSALLVVALLSSLFTCVLFDIVSRRFVPLRVRGCFLLACCVRGLCPLTTGFRLLVTAARRLDRFPLERWSCVRVPSSCARLRFASCAPLSSLCA
jgi:hypothetical protein